MKVSKPTLGLILTAAIVLTLVSPTFVLAASSYDPPLVNWSAPATWSPAKAATPGSKRALGDVTLALPFIGITPCRQYDSRNTTPLPNATNRTITITGAPCGLSAAAVAVSMNITIFNIIGQGSNGVFKVDTVTPPAFAWINYPPGEAQRGNAGVAPLTGGTIIVQVAQGSGQVDFTVDVNGYYPQSSSGTPLGSGEYFDVVGNGVGYGGVIYGRNENSTGANPTSGVRGQIISTGSRAAGVLGESLGTTGGAVGVYGSITSEAGSAGVLGTTGFSISAAAYGTSIGGVRGEGRSGVVGISQQSTGEGAVIGIAQTSSGGLGPFGYLGSIANGNYAVYGVGNFAVTGTKAFVEPHPTDAAKVIKYVALEGPESGTYFRGTARITRGQAVIDVPEDFRLVTDEEGLTVQLTPVGAAANMWIVSEDLNQIVVRSSKDVAFHYMINGVRKSFKDFAPIAENKEFVPLSADSKLSEALSPEQRQRLIANGTYNADGTPNMQTARALGWTKVWEARASPVTPARTPSNGPQP